MCVCPGGEGVCLSACWDARPPPSVCLSTGGVSASVHAGMPDPPGPDRHPPRPGRHPPSRPGRHPPGPGRHPPDQTPPGPGRHPPDRPPRTRQTPPGPGRHPPDQADTPRTRQTPPGPDTPRPGRPPPQEADSSIRSTSGRYASYWNAFLFHWSLSLLNVNITLDSLWTHLESTSLSLSL